MEHFTEVQTEKKSKKRRAGRKVREKRRTLANEVNEARLPDAGEGVETGPNPPLPPLFEIRDAGPKNLGLFATQDIVRGTRIIEEEPLLMVPIGDAMDQAVLDEFARLTDASRMRFLELSTYNVAPTTREHALVEADHDKGDVRDTQKEHGNQFTELDKATTTPTAIELAPDRVYYSDTPRAASGIELPPVGFSDSEDSGLALQRIRIDQDTKPDKAESPFYTATEGESLIDPDHIIRIYRTNAFSIETESSMVSSICPIGARLNHSCKPNVFCAFNDNLSAHTVHALRDISAGEELCTSYIPGSYQMRAERRASLEKWGFVCACSACEDSPEGAKGNRRRMKMKELDRLASEAKARFADLTTRQAEQAGVVLEELAYLMNDEGLFNPDLARV